MNIIPAFDVNNIIGMYFVFSAIFIIVMTVVDKNSIQFLCARPALTHVAILGGIFTIVYIIWNTHKTNV